MRFTNLARVIMLSTMFPVAIFPIVRRGGPDVTCAGSGCPGAIHTSDPVVTITETGEVQVLPFSVTPGDLLLFEPGSNGQVLSDVLHFFGGNKVFLYSDLEPDELDATDVPLPPSFTPSPNAIHVTEVGTEFDNGAVYEVLNTDKTVNVEYDIKSDSPVPEPSLVMLLTVGLGCLALVSLRRRVA